MALSGEASLTIQRDRPVLVSAGAAFALPAEVVEVDPRGEIAALITPVPYKLRVVGGKNFLTPTAINP